MVKLVDKPFNFLKWRYFPYVTILIFLITTLISFLITKQIYDNYFFYFNAFEKNFVLKFLVTYNDGIRELFNAIYINDSRIFTGKILKKGNHEVFIEGGGIPKNNIKHIKWKIKKTVLKKKV